MTLWTKGMGAIIKAIPRKLKVSPDIKSVSPTKLSVKESLKKIKSKEYLKRIDKLDTAQKKVKEGKKNDERRTKREKKNG